jgi:hypothetical protein
MVVFLGNSGESCSNCLGFFNLALKRHLLCPDYCRYSNMADHSVVNLSHAYYHADCLWRLRGS